MNEKPEHLRFLSVSSRLVPTAQGQTLRAEITLSTNIQAAQLKLWDDIQRHAISVGYELYAHPDFAKQLLLAQQEQIRELEVRLGIVTKLFELTKKTKEDLEKLLFNNGIKW